MKNPFLSDRNIFSKVVNPLKKKTETDNKDNPTTDSFNNKKEPFISTTPLTRPEHPKQSIQENSKEPFRFQPQQKMTFGEPPQTQNRLSFNKSSSNNAEIERKAILPKEIVKQYDYGYQSFKMTQNQSNEYTRNNYKSISLEQNQVEFKSPAQDTKFEEYRRVNNFKEYSPINVQPEKKINDSEFLNIDALGDDLNRFLAESKNQEELCQLLGIVKKPHNYSKDQTQVQKKQTQAQRQELQYYSIPNQYQKRLSQNVPSAFAKQKTKNRQSEPLQPMKPAHRVPEPKIEERQYIPTFNYMGLQHQNETVSREQQPMPRFNPVPKKQRLQDRQASRQNIEVFDYSRTNSNQGEKDIQQLIAQEMSALCMNGKYRTFLTSNEKIVTVRYKLQPL